MQLPSIYDFVGGEMEANLALAICIVLFICLAHSRVPCMDKGQYIIMLLNYTVYSKRRDDVSVGDQWG